MLLIDTFCESKREHLNDLYICAGDRVYMIGAQHGGFPDFGHHIPNEMGGIWDHPIKLMDGFWLRISDRERAGDGVWLERAAEFRNYPFYNEHHYELNELDLCAVRRQFAPDGTEGVVITYRIADTRNRGDRLLDVTFLGRTDLRPVWFAEAKGIFDGDDEGTPDEAEGLFLGRDTANPWFVVFGADRPFQRATVDKALFGPETTSGPGVSGLLVYEEIPLPAGGYVDMHFFIAGSYQSETAARDTFRKLKKHHVRLFAEKRERYQALLNRSRIEIPDKHVEKVFNWIKFHNDWLVRDVPEIGRGLGAGHPEYPWWFGCDNSYALLGVLPLGELEMAQQTLELLRWVSETENGNGRIIHEVSTCGAVSNPGNTQETPHFIKCVWDTFRWTGDIEFLRAMYPSVKQGIRWLLEEKDSDGDLLPEGYGITEIEGLNLELIDSAVYTHEALCAAASMAGLFGEPELSARYEELAARLKETINRNMWIEEEGLYADVMGTPAHVLQRMDLYIAQERERGSERAAAELEQMKAKMSQCDPHVQRPWLLKNWVINTPMEVGLAPREQAIRALDRMGTDEFTGPWGTYLSGMNRTHMMTITTGVQAVAECSYDRTDQALRYVRLIASTFSKRLPGSISEMSPDYGCFVQAWTNYGMVWPLMTHMFGIRPDAYRRELILRPRPPSDWNRLSVEGVRLGTGERANALDWSIMRGEREDVYRFSLQREGWSVRLNLAVPAGATIKVDDSPADPVVESDGSLTIVIPQASIHEIRVVKA